MFISKKKKVTHEKKNAHLPHVYRTCPHVQSCGGFTARAVVPCGITGRKPVPISPRHTVVNRLSLGSVPVNRRQLYRSVHMCDRRVIVHVLLWVVKWWVFGCVSFKTFA
jgi:hypothetical protein